VPIGQIIGFLAPLGVPGVLFIAFLFVATYLRKNQISDNTAFVQYQRAETGKIVADLVTVRAERDEAERTSDQWRDRAHAWHGRAHDMRLARTEDRQAYRNYEKKLGIDPLILTPVPELPGFLEEAE